MKKGLFDSEFRFFLGGGGGRGGRGGGGRATKDVQVKTAGCMDLHPFEELLNEGAEEVITQFLGGGREG